MIKNKKVDKKPTNFLQEEYGKVIDIKKAGNKIRDKKTGAEPGTHDLVDSILEKKFIPKGTWEESSDNKKEKE